MVMPLAVIYELRRIRQRRPLWGRGQRSTGCQSNGVFSWIDNIQPDATIAHAVILLNGRCATYPTSSR